MHSKCKGKFRLKRRKKSRSSQLYSRTKSFYSKGSSTSFHLGISLFKSYSEVVHKDLWWKLEGDILGKLHKSQAQGAKPAPTLLHDINPVLAKTALHTSFAAQITHKKLRKSMNTEKLLRK